VGIARKVQPRHPCLAASLAARVGHKRDRDQRDDVAVIRKMLSNIAPNLLGGCSHRRQTAHSLPLHDKGVRTEAEHGIDALLVEQIFTRRDKDHVFTSSSPFGEFRASLALCNGLEITDDAV
jgi:hypothetical protein